MNVTIKYQDDFSDYTISSYMNEWTMTFGNIDQAAAKERGQFSVVRINIMALNIPLAVRMGIVPP